jgi:integrase
VADFRHFVLDKPGDVGQFVGQERAMADNPKCPGFSERKRGSKTVFRITYRAVGGKQTDFVFGCLSHEVGPLASAVVGQPVQYDLAPVAFDQALAQAKGAREPMPAHLAEAVAWRLHARIKAGFDPVADLPKLKVKVEREAVGGTVKALADQFLANGRRKRTKQPFRPATLKSYRNALLGHAAELHGRQLKDLRRAELSDLIERVAAESGQGAAHALRTALGRLYTWAASKGVEGIEANPVSLIEGYGTGRPGRPLSNGELRALWAETSDLSRTYNVIVRLILLTGCRRQEIGDLRRSEIDDDGVMTIPGERTKNGRPLVLPLSKQARVLLAGWQGDPERDLLFGGGFTGWSPRKAALDKKLGFARPWRLHDLRHTVETRLAALKVDKLVVNRVLNHGEGEITGRYDHYAYLDEKQAALQLWADELDKITNGGGKVVELRKTA